MVSREKSKREKDFDIMMEKIEKEPGIAEIAALSNEIDTLRLQTELYLGIKNQKNLSSTSDSTS
jgi:hypothetical protein